MRPHAFAEWKEGVKNSGLQAQIPHAIIAWILHKISVERNHEERDNSRSKHANRVNSEVLQEFRFSTLICVGLLHLYIN